MPVLKFFQNYLQDAVISFVGDFGFAFLNTLISFSSIIQYGNVMVFQMNLNGAITKLTRGLTFYLFT